MKLNIILLIVLVMGKTQGTDAASYCFEKSANSEDCDNGCMLGYHGDFCDLPCPNNCGGYKGKHPACSQDTGYCLNGCKSGWYGDQCNRDCHGNCTDSVCDRVTGDCIHCKDDFFGIQCQDNCSENCEGQCASDGSCKCKRGFAGRACEHECSNNCLDKQCHLKSSEDDIRVCSAGCKTGYTGLYCQELCPAVCLNCNQNGSCKSGTHGSRRKREDNSKCMYYSSKSKRCECCETDWKGPFCSGRCQNCVQRFDSSNKVCIEGCSNATFGDSCEKSCSANCTTGYCDKITGKCNGCQKHHYGDYCDKECDRRCNASGCWQETGHCISCPPDRYGPYCQKTCSIGCSDGSCNQTTGNCECKDGWCGGRCDGKVSRGCSSGDTVITKHGDHACVGSCKNGYCGDSCDAFCLRCPSGCQKQSGTCLIQYQKEDHAFSDMVTAAIWIMTIFLATIIGELAYALRLLHITYTRIPQQDSSATT